MFIQAIFPAILLLVWALINLFNREESKPPERGRPSSLGPRPGTGSQPRTSMAASSPRTSRDEVIVIRSETNRSSSAPKRGRPRPPQSSKRLEPPMTKTRDLVGASRTTTLSEPLSGPMEIQSLETASVAVPTIMIGLTPTPSILDIQAALSDPARLREAFVVNELLQRPVSLRGRTRRE